MFLPRLYIVTVIALSSCAVSLHAHQEHVDLLVFSYNRPLQLYAFLESLYTYATGLASISVLYRSGDERFEQGYQVVKQQFGNVHYIKQGDNAKADFKPVTIQVIKQTATPYIIFAVDDIIIKDYVDLTECSNLLEQTGAYGFYLRLGLHINYSYPRARSTALPVYRQVGNNVYSWQFVGSDGYFNYPHTVDMTLMRKADIIPCFDALSFDAPNSLEGQWAGVAGTIMHRTGLFYATSKVVNLPLNRVQNDYLNKVMNFMTCEELQQKFEEGYKIDIQPLFRIQNSSAHMVYEPRFIKR